MGDWLYIVLCEAVMLIDRQRPEIPLIQGREAGSAAPN